MNLDIFSALIYTRLRNTGFSFGVLDILNVNKVCFLLYSLRVSGVMHTLGASFFFSLLAIPVGDAI